MSTAMQGVGLTARNAGANLTGKLYYLVKLNVAGDVVLAGAGEVVLGQVTEEATLNNPVTVQYSDIAKVITGGVVNAGDQLASDGNGKAVVATSGQYVIGIALQGGAASEIVSFLIARNRG